MRETIGRAWAPDSWRKRPRSERRKRAFPVNSLATTTQASPRKEISSPADFTNTIASSPTRARNDGRSPCCFASFFSGTAVASAMSRCTPWGSPSLSTSILAAEQCSRTSIKKVRRPLSQLVSSLLSKAIRCTGGPDLSWASTSLGEGSFWPILQPPASWTSTSPSVGRWMISSHRSVASVLIGSFVPAFVIGKGNSHNGWLCHAAKGREL